MIGVWVVSAALTFSACAPAAGGSGLEVPPPYEREAFGDGWASTGRGCDTRDVVLARDLVDEGTVRGCDVRSGRFTDPYSGAVFAGPSRELDVDHVVPLALAWRLGAWRWPEERRVAFANDLDNLQTSLARVNRSKGDQGLGEWLPPKDPCGYARRFDAVADRYGLVDAARDAAVGAACRP